MDRLSQILQRACGAGGGIKPRVERSGALGTVGQFCKAGETGDSRLVRLSALPATTRAELITRHFFPGFRYAPPWALCFRLLRRLVDIRTLTTALIIVNLFTASAMAQK